MDQVARGPAERYGGDRGVSVDQDVLVGDGCGHALEIDQITIGRDKAFQHRTGFQFGDGW